MDRDTLGPAACSAGKTGGSHTGLKCQGTLLTDALHANVDAASRAGLLQTTIRGDYSGIWN